MTLPMTTAGPSVVADVSEIAAPFPKVTGGVLYAPLGTTLPTDATSALDPAFVTLGRVSDAGVDKTEDRKNTRYRQRVRDPSDDQQGHHHRLGAECGAVGQR